MKDFQQECEKQVDSIANYLNDLANGNVDKEDECQSLYDYFNDVYDIEYRIDGRGEYRSVKLMIGFGGPNIYVDTHDAFVKLYWGGSHAQAPISYETSDEIDNIFEEMYLATK